MVFVRDARLALIESICRSLSIEVTTLAFCSAAEYSMTKSPYENRYLLYVDILGWSDAIDGNAGAELLAVLEQIHVYGAEHNERFRQELLARDGRIEEWIPGRPARVQVNPLALQVQFAAFSDHFVWSMPQSYGPAFLTQASKLIRDLLVAGYLTRGAAVVGKLYHRDNVIFGPALIEAFNAETREAYYPRILLTQSALDDLALYEHHQDDTSVVTDSTGRAVVNPYSMLFAGGTEQSIKSFVDMNYHLDKVRATIESNIGALEVNGRLAHAEKWRYMLNFIGSTVLQAEPRLRPFW